MAVTPFNPAGPDPAPGSKDRRVAQLTAQVARLESQRARLKALSNRLSWLRLVVFVGGVAFSFALYFSFGSAALIASLALMLIVFGGLVRAFRRVNALHDRLRAWAALKRTSIARARLDWPHLPAPIPFDLPADHPFARDLDLVGDFSVHQLLNTAVTREGAVRLGEWLTSRDPQASVISARQKLVGELIPLRRFRDRLTLNALLAGPHRLRAETGALQHWLQTPGQAPAARTLIGLLVLALINIGLLSGLIPLPAPLNSQCLALSFGLYGLISILNLRNMTDSFEQALGVLATLRIFQAALTTIERYPFRPESAALAALCRPLRPAAGSGSQPPSRLIRRLTRIVSATSLQSSGIVWLAINAAVPWGLFFAWLLEKLRGELQSALPAWLNVWYELEALSALATFAELNPAAHFPQIGTAGQPFFSGTALGHPLVDEAQRICNDFQIDSLGAVGLITGSNMAGKSSFLRTVGVNLCLAYAGGVVIADSLQVPLFRLFTCIKVSDSVTDGVSYFYAEVKRLKALLDALEQADPLPLFFLIDEIFRGTNNRERLIGSRAYLRALVQRHGVGLVSTHDLELITLADELPDLRNYHFAETIQGERMVFDYRLRSGPSPTTNALKIMALAGLPIQ